MLTSEMLRGEDSAMCAREEITTTEALEIYRFPVVILLLAGSPTFPCVVAFDPIAGDQPVHARGYQGMVPTELAQIRVYPEGMSRAHSGLDPWE